MVHRCKGNHRSQDRVGCPRRKGNPTNGRVAGNCWHQAGRSKVGILLVLLFSLKCPFIARHGLKSACESEKIKRKAARKVLPAKLLPACRGLQWYLTSLLPEA